MKNTKRAISLINLVVIVAIVIIIGTSIVVLSFDALNIKANKEIKFKSLIESFESSLESYKAKLYVSNGGSFNDSSLKSDLSTLEYNGTLQNGNIFDIIPSLKGSKYEKDIKIVNGKIDITNLDGKYLTWAKEQLGYGIYNDEEENKIGEVIRELGEGTSLINEAMEKKIPYVPNDFDFVEGTTIEKGYTICDSLKNEYVWVPVNDMSPFDIESNTNISGELLTTFNQIKNSISIYGGFYIGKYEASKVDGKVSSQKNMIPWTNIKWGNSTSNPGNDGAYEYAKSVSKLNNYEKFNSTLLYDSMWTATLNFIEKVNDNNSLKYGNYNGSSFSITNSKAKGSKDDGKNFEFISNKPSNTKILFTTGATDRNCIKNIYDIAGNVSEWTISLLNNDENTAIVRGGDYFELSNSVSAKQALSKSISEVSSTVGFRVALYLQ